MRSNTQIVTDEQVGIVTLPAPDSNESVRRHWISTRIVWMSLAQMSGFR